MGTDRITFGYHFSWRGTSVSAGGFETVSDCHKSLAHALKSMRWSKPKWWMFWRWGEIVPSGGVIAELERLLGARQDRSTHGRNRTPEPRSGNV